MSEVAGRAADLTPAAANRLVPGRCDGVAMVELLVALLVFSIGMLGLVGAQLGGKRAGYDALQRSVATALAGDLLERVRANPLHAPDYTAVIGGDEGESPGAPAVDCDRMTCSGAQLAAFDLWHWHTLLLGEGVADEGDGAPRPGTLRSPRACIATAGEEVEVVITWRALSGTGTRLSSGCGADSESRHRLSLTTFVGRS